MGYIAGVNTRLFHPVPGAALLAAAMLAGGCGTPSRQPALDPPASQQPPAMRCGGTVYPEFPLAAESSFVASGTEPGWRVSISPVTLDLQAHYGETRVTVPAPAPECRDGAVVYRSEGGGHEVSVAIDDAYCSNAMSGKPFPRTVTLTVDGDRFDGCGGDPASLLTGASWQVGSLNGEPVPPGPAPTLHFGTDGSVSGHDGCNRFHGSYTITGIGVGFAGLSSTRMACPDGRGALARRFLDVLEATRLFRIEDGALVLTDHGGASLTATR